jgi:hypothetical protein
MAKVFRPGDRVAYATAWLKSTGQHTGWAPKARGSVLGVEAFGDRALVTVQWDGRDKPIGVLDANLTLVSRLALDAALAT